jgi:hypothetical protein
VNVAWGKTGTASMMDKMILSQELSLTESCPLDAKSSCGIKPGEPVTRVVFGWPSSELVSSVEDEDTSRLTMLLIILVIYLLLRIFLWIFDTSCSIVSFLGTFTPY